MRCVIISIFCIIFLQGCQWSTFSSGSQKKDDSLVTIPSVTLQSQSFSDLSDWNEDRHSEPFVAFIKSCGRLNKKQTDGLMKKTGVAGKYSDWQMVCAEAQYVPKGDDVAAKRYFERWFVPYLVRDKVTKKENGLFTGYYEPLLNGSWEQKGKYQTPLYTRPDDLIDVNLGDFRDKLSGERIAGRIKNGKLIPYYDRSQIDDGALIEQGKPLLWVDSQVQAFFLHIQGSGNVKMEDGSFVRVGYDGQNGHVYYAIGRYLVDIGVLTKKEVSLPSIRQWLLENSTEAQALMNKNKSYIFFRKLDGLESPLGGEGVELTDGRSLAVDHRIWPYGIPIWLDVSGVFSEGNRIRRLMVAQDTGGAIRGAVRGDVFWGNGKQAENYAGHMKSRGQYWILLPNNIEIPGELVWKEGSFFNEFTNIFKKPWPWKF